MYKLNVGIKQNCDQRTSTESELTGSNYSGMEKEARKMRKFTEGVDESNSNSKEDKESPLKDKEKKMKKATSIKGKDMASNNKGKE